MTPDRVNNEKQKEYIADLLKERIYATLALIAVLVSIDTSHSSALNAGYIICGTIISLWAASIVATQMSRRMIFQNDIDHKQDRELQIRRHAPMLLSLVFPVFMLLFAQLHIVSLGVAIDISIASALLLLIGWSINSARSLHSKKVPTFILIVIQLAIGLSIVGLKILVEH